MRVCLLVTTYRRNRELFRLLDQFDQLRRTYPGAHHYTLIVTDSDPSNPDADRIRSRCAKYVINTGSGFDDNLLGCYRHHLDGFDYVLSMSDDDLFASSAIHPWLLLDAPVIQGATAALFNHLGFTHAADGAIRVGKAYYGEPAMAFDATVLLHTCLSSLPRHIGLLYSVPWIRKCLPELEAFRGTRHLYAVPFLLAAVAGEAIYSEATPQYFCADPPSSGAWEIPRGVFDGLLAFLVALKPRLSPGLFNVARSGFLRHYLGDGAWLRLHLQACGASAPPAEAAVCAMLDASPSAA